MKKIARVFSAICLLSLLTVVIMVAPVSATPSITVTPRVVPGGVVVVAGEGFGDNVNVTINCSLWAATDYIKTDANGTFTLPKVISTSMPLGTIGIFTVTTLGHEKITGEFEVVSILTAPKITLETDSGSLGGNAINVNGTGFSGNSPVKIFVDDVLVSNFVTPPSVDSGGNLKASFVLISSTSGERVIKAEESYGTSNSVIFTVAPPKLTLSRSVAVGKLLNVSGSGFYPEAQVTIYRDGLPLMNVLASQTGTFNIDLTIPKGASSLCTIRAIDAYNNSDSAQYNIVPEITISRDRGGYMDDVVVTGIGWTASNSGTITCGSVSNVVTTSADGTFEYAFKLPKLAAGTVLVEAKFGTDVATKSITVTQKISYDPATSATNQGHVGMDMTIDGTGFRSDAAITVTMDGVTLSGVTTRTDEGGSFNVTFKIPVVSAGSHKIGISDGFSPQLTVDFFMDSIAPGAVTLLLPAVDSKPNQPVSFSWNSVIDPSGVTYTLQISQDINFTTLLLARAGLETAAYKMDEADKLSGSDTPYYWRVKAIDKADNEGEWSAVGSFIVSTPGIVSGWPTWATVVAWVAGGVLVIAAILVAGLWLGRRMAFKSY